MTRRGKKPLIRAGTKIAWETPYYENLETYGRVVAMEGDLIRVTDVRLEDEDREPDQVFSIRRRPVRIIPTRRRRKRR